MNKNGYSLLKFHIVSALYILYCLVMEY